MACADGSLNQKKSERRILAGQHLAPVPAAFGRREGYRWLGRRVLLAAFSAASIITVNPALGKEVKTDSTSTISTPARNPSNEILKMYYGSPFPFDYVKIWTKLTSIIALNEGQVTQSKIESIFGKNLNQKVIKDIGGERHSVLYLESPLQWYYNINLTLQKNGPQFIFEWNHNVSGKYYASPQPPSDICIRPDLVLKTTKNIGWQYVDHGSTAMEGVHTPDRYYFRRKSEALEIDFDWQSDCLISLNMHP